MIKTNEEFEHWWAMNIYNVRDTSEKEKTQHEKLKTAARIVWDGCAECKTKGKIPLPK